MRIQLWKIVRRVGLIPGLIYSVDKICMYAGFACFGLGLVYLAKAKDNNEDK